MNDGTDGSTGPLGLVLAGGASSRMGRDKARLALPDGPGGYSLAGWAAEQLAQVTGEVVVADGGQGLVPGFRSLPDGPGRGPAAGILGASMAFPGRALLVLACDLPLVPVPLLDELARAEGDWVVPRQAGRVEPLCALYGPAALEALATRVGRGLLALHSLAGEPGLAIHYLDPPEADRIFLNLNTPEDWDRYVEISAGGPPH